MATLTSLQQAFEAVVHLPLNVQEEEGVSLSKRYKVGTTYPVFILTDNSGEVFTRWTGYTGGAPVLIATLKNALTNLTPMSKRLAKFEANKTYKEALALATYSSDHQDYLEAVRYYRIAVGLGKVGGYDYAFQIFNNMANAAWNGLASFDSASLAAGAVLNGKVQLPANLLKTAQIIANLSRKLKQTDKIKKHLEAALSATKGSTDPEIKKSRADVGADYALHVLGDTARALTIKKKSLGSGWESNRDLYYNFALWCLLRKINLVEAERFTRLTVDRVYPGKYKAKALNTLADICFAQGKRDEAIVSLNQAISEDPANKYYPKHLIELQNDSGDAR